MSVAPYDRSRPHVVTDGCAALGVVPLPGRGGTDDRPAQRGCLHAVLDGRLDDRAGLVNALVEAGMVTRASASDADLVLQAYAQWGRQCVMHLVGDFAFCVWDGARQELFCARDHFGVKPLYYSVGRDQILVSTALSGLRCHPAVDARLRDEAIGDLILFGTYVEPAHTAFRGINRLPPGSCLRWSRGEGPRAERYWADRLDMLPRPADPDSYVQEFSALLSTAVADRVRSDRITVLMSGGLDSTSVATVAAEHLGAVALDRLQAVTVVYRSAMREEESRYSSLVAKTVGIPLAQHVADGYVPFERWTNDARPPEPTLEALTAVMCDVLDRAAAHGSVVMTGDGGDPLLLPSTVVEQVGKVPLVTLMADLWRARSISPLGLRSSAAAWFTKTPSLPWLAGDLLRRFDPVGRWHDVQTRRRSRRGGRNRAVSDVLDPWWASTFEGFDPCATGRAVEPRYPFFDLRLASFVLRLPSFPWCLNKRILRESMSGRLPEAVRRRPKRPLPGNPVGPAGRWTLARALALFEQTPEIERFVDIGRFRATVRHDSLLTGDSPGTWAAISIAAWLRSEAGHSLPALQS